MGKDKEPANEPQQEEDPNDPKNMKPACGCCCGPSGDEDLVPEHLQDTEDFFGNRSCTDCCMVVLYAIFIIGWIIVISLAIQFGKPDRIIKPENFRGDLCGDGRLEAYPVYFVPLPSRSTYGVCAKTCPSVGDVVCNNDIEPKVENTAVNVANHYYDQTKAQFAQTLKDYATCKTSECGNITQASADRYIATQLKLKQRKCFVAFYPSAPSLLRCIPGKGSGSTNTTLQSLANESAQTLSALADTLGVGSFFTLGFAEIEQTWRVILITSFTCMAIALIWVLLLRWILAPIVYFVIFLILGVLIGLGFVFKYFADDLESGALPGETGVDNQIKLWRAAEYIAFLLAAIYFGVMLHMLQRIRIAIAVMKEASKAFMSAPSMVFIPLITFFMLIGWIAFFVVTTVYIQTMGSEAAEAFNQAATDLLGENVNISALISANGNSSISASAAKSASSIPTVNISQWATLPQTKTLHLYNFFGVLWTGNVCLMFGFMTMAMTVCSWYFSATQIQLRALESEDEAEREEKGKDKQTVPFAVAKAAWCTFFKHLGTVIWGALLIAIIQFIRAIFTYIAENYLKEAKDNWAAKILIRCAECCLWYIEQVIKLISKNAFIITAIRNTSFCVSAFTALKLLLCNAARLVILSMLSAATLFLVKCFVVGINVFIAFGLLKETSLTNDKHVESGLFPIFLITVMSFVIASLFMNVYEACIDTIFLCFLVDEEEFKGKFMPKSLEEIVKVFEGADIARREYEKNVKQAMIKAEASAEAGKK